MLRVHRLLRLIGAIAVFAGLFAGGALVATPAQADPSSDAFLNAVTSAGLGSTTDPTDMVALGKSVCPMLSDPGQNAADLAMRDTRSPLFGADNAGVIARGSPSTSSYLRPSPGSQFRSSSTVIRTGVLARIAMKHI